MQFCFFSREIFNGNSFGTTNSDVFYVEQSADEQSPTKNNNPDVLNSTECSEHLRGELPQIPPWPPGNHRYSQMDPTSATRIFLGAIGNQTQHNPKLKRFESTTQLFFISVNKGSDTTKSGATQQKAEPSTAGALRNIISFNAADGNQFCQHLGHIFRRAHFLFR